MHNETYETDDFRNAYAADLAEAVVIAKLMFGAKRKVGGTYNSIRYVTADGAYIMIQWDKREGGSEWHIGFDDEYYMREVAPVAEAVTVDAPQETAPTDRKTLVAEARNLIEALTDGDIESDSFADAADVVRQLVEALNDAPKRAFVVVETTEWTPPVYGSEVVNWTDPRDATISEQVAQIAALTAEVDRRSAIIENQAAIMATLQSQVEALRDALLFRKPYIVITLETSDYDETAYVYAAVFDQTGDNYESESWYSSYDMQPDDDMQPSIDRWVKRWSKRFNIPAERIFDTRKSTDA